MNNSTRFFTVADQRAAAFLVLVAALFVLVRVTCGA